MEFQSKSKNFIPVSTFEYVICKTSVIFFEPKCVNYKWIDDGHSFDCVNNIQWSPCPHGDISQNCHRRLNPVPRSVVWLCSVWVWNWEITMIRVWYMASIKKESYPRIDKNNCTENTFHFVRYMRASASFIYGLTWASSWEWNMEPWTIWIYIYTFFGFKESKY